MLSQDRPGYCEDRHPHQHHQQTKLLSYKIRSIWKYETSILKRGGE
jgi:hypothetical protein